MDLRGDPFPFPNPRKAPLKHPHWIKVKDHCLNPNFDPTSTQPSNKLLFWLQNKPNYTDNNDKVYPYYAPASNDEAACCFLEWMRANQAAE